PHAPPPSPTRRSSDLTQPALASPFLPSLGAGQSKALGRWPRNPPPPNTVPGGTGRQSNGVCWPATGPSASAVVPLWNNRSLPGRSEEHTSELQSPYDL